MPRKKAEKPEAVEQKSEETMDKGIEEQTEAVLSDSDKKSPEGAEGENAGEEISQIEPQNPDGEQTASAGSEGRDENMDDESQSDTETAQETEEVGGGEETPQTDIESPEGEVYPSEDALDSSGSSEEQSQSDTEEAQAVDTADAMRNAKKNKAKQNQSGTEAKKQEAQVPGEGRGRRRGGKSSASVRPAPSQVLAIDGHLVAETEAEKESYKVIQLRYEVQGINMKLPVQLCYVQKTCTEIMIII